MSKRLEGMLQGKGLKFGVVVSRFNEFFTAKLLEGAVDALLRHGVEEDDIEIAWTPGSFEIPLVAQTLAKSKKYDAVICLAAVIRGGTPHFDYISAEVTKGIAKVGLDTGLPVIYGVITTDTLEQAIEVTRHQGRIVILGGFRAPLTLDWLQPLLKEQSIIFSSCYSIMDGRHDYELAIEMIASGRAPVEQMVTHRFPLEEAQRAFETAYDKSTGSIKVQFQM